MFQNVSYKAYIKDIPRYSDALACLLVRVPKMRIFTKPVSESDPMWSNKMVDRGCMKIHFYSE